MEQVLKGSRASRLGLQILSLLLAFGLWLFVSSDRLGDESDRAVTASVTYDPPENLIILNPVTAVTVRLKGRRRDLTELNPQMVGVVVNLDAEEIGELDPTEVGDVEKRISSDNVFVPEKLEVISIDPDTLHLQVDYMDSQVIPVLPRLQGEPAAGARQLGWEVVPDQVTAIGPRTILEKFSNLSTEVVVLDTHALTFEEWVNIESPDPLISTQPTRVRVRVLLEPPDLSSSVELTTEP